MLAHAVAAGSHAPDFTNGRNRGRRRRPDLPVAIYPAGVVAVIWLHVWAVSGVSLFAATRSLAVGLAMALAVLVMTRIVVRDRDRGGVLAVFLLLGLMVGGSPFGLVMTLLGISLVVGEHVLGGRSTIRWGRVGSALMIAIAIGAGGALLETIELGRVGDLITTLATETPLRSRSIPPAPASAPDVYVILLDGYARHDVLANRFGMDDRPFLDGLRGLGFTIADGSHSNYVATNPSLASFLNHRHLADISAVRPLLADPTVAEGPPIHRAISDPAGIDDFHMLGYETIAIASGFNQASIRGADEFIDTGQISGFEIALLRTSILAPIATTISADVLSGSQRDRIEATFEALEGLAEVDGEHPRFVFGHVPSPHAPWVHEADGSPRVVASLNDWYADVPGIGGLTHETAVSGYANEVAYIGSRTLIAVERILENSSRPPVILVISDHGSFLDVDPADPEIRLRNLFAAYTPGAHDVFRSNVTLVEVIPILFDAYFGIELGTAEPTLYAAGANGVYDLVALPAASQPTDE